MKFNDLDDRAKQQAREKWCQHVFEDSCDWEHVIEEAVTVGELLGVTIGTHPVKLMGGDTRYKPSIYWSGFYHQGSGLGFNGAYRWVNTATPKIKEYAPEDTELHRIAEGLDALQMRKALIQDAAEPISAVINERNGNHIAISIEEDDLDFEDEIKEYMEAFASWIYDALETEYEYQTSDEVVDEALIANDYDFNESGYML